MMASFEEEAEERGRPGTGRARRRVERAERRATRIVLFSNKFFFPLVFSVRKKRYDAGKNR